MKPSIAIAVYELKNHSDQNQLLDLLQSHEKTLRSEQLLTDRPQLILKADEKHYLEMIEWKSEAHARKAHESKKVQTIWGDLEKLVGFTTLGKLPTETLNVPFPKFEAVLPEPCLTRVAYYSDNMISAKNFEKTVGFYQELFGLKKISESAEFAILVDPVSQQKLCITNGESVSKMSPGIASENLEATLASFQSAGGKILKEWSYPKMKGANCEDPEGNEVLIWQELLP